MMLIDWPLGTSTTPPANCNDTVETPLTTVIVRVVVVAVSKLLESVGVKTAVRDTEPKAPGVQEQVAVVLAAAADPHPEIVEPPSLKLTMPARGTVAVIVTAPPSAAFEALFGREIEIEVDALLTVIVSVLLPTCELPSVARTV
jgi:hypothetical protein